MSNNGGTTRSKVLGMLVGGTAGDALGYPVETWTPERIVKVHGAPISHYVDPVDHKWFTPEDMPAGSITDDTQLTLATLGGLIAGHANFDDGHFAPYMDAIAHAHCKALRESDAGWGASTREAVKNLCNAVSWRDSGKSDKPRRGTGNGVVMKIAPLAAWYCSPVGARFGDNWSFNQACVTYSSMTHFTQMSAQAAVLHANALVYCLARDFEDFSERQILDFFSGFNSIWSWANDESIGQPIHFDVSFLNETEDKLQDPFQLLWEKWDDGSPDLDRDTIRELFGGGSCYVYHSLPFTYAFFLQRPHSMEMVLDVVNAGGDTDTNAKMAGELLGALHGIEFFEEKDNKWVIEGLGDTYGTLQIAAEAFCDTFEIED